MSIRFSLGIDLGTSNSAIALEDFASGRNEIVEITQILGLNQVGEKPTLPSALYIPHPDEFPQNGMQLPWSKGVSEPIIGHFARDHGALIPDRLITSAKSWLSNFHIDPKKPVLPWKSDIKEQKLSAFECSRRYLEHMREGFLYAESTHGRAWKLEEGLVVLTVPASFDEIARNLTAAAAESAGFGGVVLLEEPQAAFYAWTAQAGNSWRTQVRRGDIVLVCDVGGGTADFSLIAVTEKDGNLEVERISVGEHILLGGDNMDLALAYTLKAQLEAAGKSIDAWQFLALMHGASLAKVNLFTDLSLAASSGRSSLPRFEFARQDSFHQAKPGHPRTSDPGRFFPSDQSRRSTTGIQERRSSGVRPPICVGPGRQQASRPLSDPKPHERQGQRYAFLAPPITTRSAGGRIPSNRRPSFSMAASSTLHQSGNVFLIS